MLKKYLTVEVLLGEHSELTVEEASSIVEKFNEKVKAKYEQRRQEMLQFKNSRRSEEIL